MSTVSTPVAIPGTVGRSGAGALALSTGRGEDPSAAGEFATLLALLVPGASGEPDPDSVDPDGPGQQAAGEAAAALLAGAGTGLGAVPTGPALAAATPTAPGRTAEGLPTGSVVAGAAGAAATSASAGGEPGAAVPAGIPTTTPVPASTAGAPAPVAAAEGAPEAAPSPAGVTGLAGAASVPVEGAATPERAAVLEQVGRVLEAQVGRAAQRGDGTQRLTLTLYPATLGEVQVTLTVRGGEVQVHLAASGSAQAALADDGGALHRLLERAGAGTTRLTVGELGTSAPVRVDAPVATTPAPAAASAEPTDSQPAAQQGQQDEPQDRAAHDPAGTGGHTDHQRAGTRAGDTTATDGSREGTGTAGPPHDPATRTRPGVDVTM